MPRHGGGPGHARVVRDCCRPSSVPVSRQSPVVSSGAPPLVVSRWPSAIGSVDRRSDPSAVGSPRAWHAAPVWSETVPGAGVPRGPCSAAHLRARTAGHSRHVRLRGGARPHPTDAVPPGTPVRPRSAMRSEIPVGTRRPLRMPDVSRLGVPRLRGGPWWPRDASCDEYRGMPAAASSSWSRSAVTRARRRTCMCLRSADLFADGRRATGMKKAGTRPAFFFPLRCGQYGAAVALVAVVPGASSAGVACT